jgi:hypothetical protein
MCLVFGRRLCGFFEDYPSYPTTVLLNAIFFDTIRFEVHEYSLSLIRTTLQLRAEGREK